MSLLTQCVRGQRVGTTSHAARRCAGTVQVAAQLDAGSDHGAFLSCTPPLQFEGGDFGELQERICTHAPGPRYDDGCN